MINIKYIIILIILFYTIKNYAINKNILIKHSIEENDTALYYYRESITKIKNKLYQDAIDLLNKAIAIDTNLTEAYLKRAEIKSKFLDYKAALSDYTKASKIKNLSWQKSYEIYFQKGITQALFFKLKDAMSSFDMAIKINPEFAEAYYNRSIVKGQLGDYLGELSDINKALELKPDDADAYNSRGILKSVMGDYLGAINDYNRAIKINPNSSSYYYNKAIILFDLNEFYQTVESLDQTIKLNKDAESYNRRGNAKFKLNDLRGAFDDFTHAIKIDSTFYISYLNRGIIKFELKDYYSSIIDLDKSIQINPDYYKSYFFRGLINCKIGKHINEVNDYSMAIFFKSDFELAYHKRAKAKYEIGDTYGACIDLQKALSMGIEDSENSFKKYCR